MSRSLSTDRKPTTAKVEWKANKGTFGFSGRKTWGRLGGVCNATPPLPPFLQRESAKEERLFHNVVNKCLLLTFHPFWIKGFILMPSLLNLLDAFLRIYFQGTFSLLLWSHPWWSWLIPGACWEVARVVFPTGWGSVCLGVVFCLPFEGVPSWSWHRWSIIHTEIIRFQGNRVSSHALAFIVL